MDEQRFDTIVKDLAGKLRSRRMLAGGLGAMLLANAAFRPGAAKPTAKSRSKGKGKGPKKQKPKTKPTTPQPADPCDIAFVLQDNRDYCRFIRRQCDGDDPREFCIIDNPELDSVDKIAVCCVEHSVCCGGQCCGSTRDTHLQCCDGECRNFNLDRENCGACGKTCGVGQVCRNGDCICDDRACPKGQRCIKNNQTYCVGAPDPACECGCGINFKYCPNHYGGACVSQGSPVC